MHFLFRSSWYTVKNGRIAHWLSIKIKYYVTADAMMTQQALTLNKGPAGKSDCMIVYYPTMHNDDKWRLHRHALMCISVLPRIYPVLSSAIALHLIKWPEQDHNCTMWYVNALTVYTFRSPLDLTTWSSQQYFHCGPFYLPGSIQSSIHSFCYHSKMKNVTSLWFLFLFKKGTLLHEILCSN